MKPKGTIMWVDPQFKMLIKSRAAIGGKTILDFTREMATYPDKSLLEEEASVKYEKRKPFTFKL